MIRLKIFLILAFMSQMSLAETSRQPQTLHMEEVFHSIDHYFPQILIARQQVTQAKGQLLASYGKFDPQINATTRSLPFGGYVSNYIDTELNLPTYVNGLRIFGGYRNGVGDWPIYYQNYLTNNAGEYRTGVAFPLLRNRKIDNERTDILTQVEYLKMSSDQVQAMKIKVYHEAIQVYWNWVQNGHQLMIFKELLKLAKVRQHAIEQQAQQGDLPMLAVVENQQVIVQREQLVQQGRLMLEQSANDLAFYYRDQHGKPFRPRQGQLPAELKTHLDISHQFITQLQSQIQQHPELRKLNKLLKIASLKKDLAKNDLQPFLDLTAYTSKQYGINGYPLLIPQAGFVGLSFRFPTLQREAKGRFISASSELKQVQNESQFRLESLLIRLQNLLIGFHISQKQIKLFTQEYQLAKKVEHGERVRFFNGDSSLFLVNQRETLSTQAKINVVNSKIVLNKIKYQLKYYLTQPCRAHGFSQNSLMSGEDAIGLKLIKPENLNDS
jgi:outer membrane protein TolC